MTELLIHKARFVATGGTIKEMQAHATAEFRKLFEGQPFSMQTVGEAKERSTLDTGVVFLWEQEYEAVNG